jgi:hypothetical protein
MTGRGMEQSPGAYESADEEARRQYLRTTLNTHYIGKASAEAFNFKGKTDILVQMDGKALLVAECKFWTGSKGFSETIDQSSVTRLGATPSSPSSCSSRRRVSPNRCQGGRDAKGSCPVRSVQRRGIRN